jgi:hypothetical protein
MAWRTYTPDGRTLEVDRLVDGLWIAACESGTATAPTPAAAIHEALGSQRTIGGSPQDLAAWIARQAEQYERELSES